MFFVWISSEVQAAPYQPAEDGQVLEKLPVSPMDPEAKALKQMRQALAQDSGNVSLAAALARRYIEEGRAYSDPRYFGYAQGVLSPWWNESAPPLEVLILRATLRQSLHDFDGALSDLNQALSRDPQNSQARLIRAVVFQVKGEYSAAQRDCLSLVGSVSSLSWATCLSGASASGEELRKSRGVLESLLVESARAPLQEKLWARTVLAETALRLGEEKTAEIHFQEALRLNPRESYLLGAYADLLLDQGRFNEVVGFLKDETRIDALLLRLALAEKALKASEFSLHRQWLSDRFAASRLRGDSVHRREEARFCLHLSGETDEALKLARENWGVQKEPADLKILLETALQASDASSLQSAVEWMKKSGLEDQRLSPLTKLAGDRRAGG